MRRAPIVLSATVVGAVAVLTFKPKEPTLAPPASTPSPSDSHQSVSGASTGGSHGGAVATAGRPKVITGAAVTTQYGTTQVRVTLSGGRIIAIQAIRINEDDPRSYQISSQAVPVLGQEVLQRRTAAVDAVSGATFTSEAYEASLQAALDRVGYRAPDGSRASTQTPSEQGGGPPGGPPSGGV